MSEFWRSFYSYKCDAKTTRFDRHEYKIIEDNQWHPQFLNIFLKCQYLKMFKTLLSTLGNIWHYQPTLINIVQYWTIWGNIEQNLTAVH